MKRLVSVGLLLLLLAGCANGNEGLDRAMALRAKLLASGGCSFSSVITADYGDELQEFTVTCEADPQGNVSFCVKEPQTIAGITGKLSAKGGELTFDDQAVAFPLLADDQVTPVSAPWLLIKTLTGGYVTSCGSDGDTLRLTINDSYDSDALVVDIWLGEGDLPIRAEFSYRDRRILSMEIESFQIL